MSHKLWSWYIYSTNQERMNHHRMSHWQTREGMWSVGGTVVRVSRAGAGQLSLDVRRVTANIPGTGWVTSSRQDPEICLTATATVDNLNQKVCCVDKILKICRCRYEGHQTKIQNQSEMLRVRGTLHCTTNIVIIAPIFLSTLYEAQIFWPLSQISDC